MNQSQITSPKSKAVGSQVLDLLKENIREYGMLIALITIMIFFQWRTEGVLLKPINITNLFLQNSYVIIMALGMLLIIVSGWIDLSIGSIAALVGAVSAVAMIKYDVNWLIAIIIGLIAGGIMGAWQGYWVAFQKIPAFIVTLAGMLMFRGFTYLILNGEQIGPFPENFQKLSTGFIPDWFAFLNIQGLHLTTILIGAILSTTLIILDLRDRNNKIKYNFEVPPFVFFLLKSVMLSFAIMGLTYLMASYKGLPNVLVLMFVFIALYTFVTNQTVLGRRIYAMGGNEKAARLSGVNTPKLLFLTFVNMGVLAALGGLIVAARLNSATPKAGQNFELDVIAACFIGGASASGGIGTVIGAVVGAFFVGVMNNGMSILGIGIDWQLAIKGLVLLLAVFFDVYNKNKN